MAQNLESLVLGASERGATHVFLVAGEPPTYRIDGRIVRGEGSILGPDETFALAYEAIGERLSELRERLGSTYAPLSFGQVRAGATVARTGGAWSVALHVYGPLTFDPEALRIPAALVRAVETASHGLVVVTGPSGSGKTSTAYALLERLNRTRDVHVATVEDPVEVRLEPKRALVQQRQVGVDVPDFLSGIVAGRVQDLDVLYVGEVRSVEVLQASVAAAETGHLVILPLHQPTPEAALQRVIDLQPAETRDVFRRMLARTLVAVSAQRLVPRADGTGRVLASGVLLADESVRRAVASPGDLGALPGSPSLEDDLRSLVERGVITAAAAASPGLGFIAS